MSRIESGKPFLWMYWENPQGKPTPPHIRLCWETIKQKCQDDFEIVIVTPENVANYLPDLNPGYQLFEKIAHKADYIRFNLLYRHSGIWIDSDFIAFRSLKPVVDKIEEFGFVYTGYKVSANKIFPLISFLGAVKEHPIMKALIRQAELCIEERLKKGVQPAWDEIGGNALKNLINKNNGYCYETHFFFPIKTYYHCRPLFLDLEFEQFIAKDPFGQSLAQSVIGDFLTYMGTDLLKMNNLLARMFQHALGDNWMQMSRFLFVQNQKNDLQKGLALLRPPGKWTVLINKVKERVRSRLA